MNAKAWFYGQSFNGGTREASINFDNQSIKRMIRSGYFGDRTCFTGEDIRRNADECGVPVPYFVQLLAEVAEEITAERARW